MLKPSRIQVVKGASLIGAILSGSALILNGHSEQGLGVIFASLSSINLAQ